MSNAAAMELETLVVPVVAEIRQYIKDMERVITIARSTSRRLQAEGKNMATAMAVTMAGAGRAAMGIADDYTRAFGSMKIDTQMVRAEVGELKRALMQMGGAAAGGARIGLNAVNEELKETGRVTKVAKRGLGDIESRMRAIGGLGLSLTAGLTAPIVGMAAASMKASIDFQSAFAGVQKTIKATPAELDALRAGIRGMSREIPITAVEIAKVAEAAGQLGIQTPAILEFTRVASEMGTATNMSADDAATGMARFANIMQMPQNEFRKLADTIVQLGSNGASTESEIMTMALRIAGSGKQVGLAEHQVLAFANALSSLGIQAEMGGSAISEIMVDMASAVSAGGEELAMFQRVARMMGVDFAQTFKTDAAGAMNAFFQGLGRIKEQGGDVLAVLAEMDITEDRMRDTVLRLAGSGNLLAQSLRDGAAGWESSNALAKEAEERFKTMASQLAIAKNRLTDVAISLGDALMPSLTSIIATFNSGLPYIESFVKWFAQLPQPVRTTAVVMAGVLAAVGPLMVALAGAGFVISQATVAFGGMGVALGVLKAAFWAMMAPVATLQAGIVNLYAGIYGLNSAVGASVPLLTMFAFALAAAGIVYAAYHIHQTYTAVADLNREIEKGLVLTGRISKLQEARRQTALSDVMKQTDPTKRAEGLKALSDSASKEAAGARASATGARARFEQVEKENMGVTGIRALANNKHLIDVAEKEAQEAEASASAAEQFAQSIKSQLQLVEATAASPGQTFGMSWEDGAKKATEAVAKAQAAIQAEDIARKQNTVAPIESRPTPATAGAIPGAAAVASRPTGYGNPMRKSAAYRAATGQNAGMNIQDFARPTGRRSNPLRRRPTGGAAGVAAEANDMMAAAMSDFAPNSRTPGFRGAVAGTTGLGAMPFKKPSAVPAKNDPATSVAKAPTKTPEAGSQIGYLADIALNTAPLRTMKTGDTLVPAKLRT